MPTTVMRSPSESTAEPSSRFTFIDALRGLAACWVMVYHFNQALTCNGAQPIFTGPVHFVLSHGRGGVQLFFVISGFVLAYSLRNARISPRFFGLFLLRRAVRLDPPYWATIALAIAAVPISNLLLPDRQAELPGWSKIAAHLLYLQNILGFGDLVDVFWTLCLEVQLYAVFVLLLGLGQFVTPARQATGRLAIFGLFMPLTALSLAIQFGALPSPCDTMMFKYWYLFQLGITTFWVRNRTLNPLYLYGFVGVLAALMSTVAFQADCLVGIGAAMTIHVADRLDCLHRWLAQRPMQYLGRISYSLYLVHNLVGFPLVGLLGKHFVGAHPGLGAALLLFTGACGVSLLTAHGLYRLVERPTLRLSKAIVLPGSRTEPPGETLRQRADDAESQPRVVAAARGRGQSRGDRVNDEDRRIVGRGQPVRETVPPPADDQQIVWKASLVPASARSAVGE